MAPAMKSLSKQTLDLALSLLEIDTNTSDAKPGTRRPVSCHLIVTDSRLAILVQMVGYT